jgi:hypothetical protein
MNNSGPDELSVKLRAWHVSPRVPASFHHEVWQRIAARQGEHELAVWPRVTEWFSTRFVRPQVALAAVLLSLSISIGAAHLQARQARTQHWKALEDKYAASIDPRLMGR